MLWMVCVIFVWHSLGIPYNYFDIKDGFICMLLKQVSVLSTNIGSQINPKDQYFMF